MAFIVVVGVVLGGHTAWQFLSTSGRLAVRDVRITGRDRASEAEVVAYSGIRANASVLNIDVDEAAASLRTHPWIKDASVRRNLAGAFEIHLQEYTPEALVNLVEVYLADAGGTLFKRLGPEDPVELPVISGLGRDDFLTDGRGGESVREAVALAKAYRVSSDSLPRLDGVWVDDVLGFTIVVAHHPTPVTIHLGLDAVARIRWIEPALRRLGKLGQIPREIWLDHPTRANRIQVRLARSGLAINSQEKETLFAKADEHGSF